MSRWISATEAHNHLGQLVRWTVENNEPVIIERRGEPYAVLISIAEYERLQTGEQLQTWQTALERALQVAAAIRARRGGEPLTAPEEVIRQCWEA
jgi:prevent-host-death family protein